MRYEPKEINWSDGWDKCRALMKENEALLKKIDKEAKDKGELLWRYFEEGVADGAAVYQIIRINRHTVRIAHCTELGDDYIISYWGSEATIDKAYAQAKVAWRDSIDELFAKKAEENNEGS